jgi:hypothetical protein
MRRLSTKARRFRNQGGFRRPHPANEIACRGSETDSRVSETIATFCEPFRFRQSWARSAAGYWEFWGRLRMDYAGLGHPESRVLGQG